MILGAWSLTDLSLLTSRIELPLAIAQMVIPATYDRPPTVGPDSISTG